MLSPEALTNDEVTARAVQLQSSNFEVVSHTRPHGPHPGARGSTDRGGLATSHHEPSRRDAIGARSSSVDRRFRRRLPLNPKASIERATAISRFGCAAGEELEAIAKVGVRARG